MQHKWTKKKVLPEEKKCNKSELKKMIFCPEKENVERNSNMSMSGFWIASWPSVQIIVLSAAHTSAGPRWLKNITLNSLPREFAENMNSL